jgi:hypothetical protein
MPEFVTYYVTNSGMRQWGKVLREMGKIRRQARVGWRWLVFWGTVSAVAVGPSSVNWRRRGEARQSAEPALARGSADHSARIDVGFRAGSAPGIPVDFPPQRGG